MADAAQRGASLLWIMLLTIAGTATTLAFACATPFAALAALAATQMRRRDGVLLMIATWAASQAVGFGLLHYPQDGRTIAWGVALGFSAVTAVFAARVAVDRGPMRREGSRMAVAFIVATLASIAVVALAATLLGGLDIALSPRLNALQAARNAGALVGLYALYRGLLALGAPPAVATRPELA